jgi:hypothetical protein
MRGMSAIRTASRVMLNRSIHSATDRAPPAGVLPRAVSHGQSPCAIADGGYRVDFLVEDRIIISVCSTQDRALDFVPNEGIMAALVAGGTAHG